MSARNSLLFKKLRYSIPRLRLCLVHEGATLHQLRQIKNPYDAVDFLEPLRYSSEEQFVSLHLNSRQEIIGLHEVSHGSLSASLVHPREVFKAAILANSYAILVCHNHPSGSQIIPSAEDLATTSQLLKAGRMLGIQMVDHLILSPSRPAYSLRENHPHLWAN